jgi:hypothetical protein
VRGERHKDVRSCNLFEYTIFHEKMDVCKEREREREREIVGVGGNLTTLLSDSTLYK